LQGWLANRRGVIIKPMSILIVFMMMAMTAQNDAPRTRDGLVTVSGCVSGNHLKLPSGTTAAVAGLARASEFVLEGSKELLRTIQKDHDRHYEEVTGTLEIPPVKTREVIRQKQLDPKTRITVGYRESAGEEQPAPVRLRVSSFRHIADRCKER
jgi:hypothetical protein